MEIAQRSSFFTDKLKMIEHTFCQQTIATRCVKYFVGIE
jgi:hypothetical protein